MLAWVDRVDDRLFSVPSITVVGEIDNSFRSRCDIRRLAGLKVQPHREADMVDHVNNAIVGWIN